LKRGVDYFSFNSCFLSKVPYNTSIVRTGPRSNVGLSELLKSTMVLSSIPGIKRMTFLLPAWILNY